MLLTYKVEEKNNNTFDLSTLEPAITCAESMSFLCG